MSTPTTEIDRFGNTTMWPWRFKCWRCGVNIRSEGRACRDCIPHIKEMKA